MARNISGVDEVSVTTPQPFEAGSWMAAHLAPALDVLPVAIYTTDAEGRILYFNREAAELWGREPDLRSAAWCGSWKLSWPDGSPMPHEVSPMAVAVRERRAIRGSRAFAERPDGTRVPFLAYPTPLFEEGRFVGAVNMLVDISGQERANYFEQRLAAIVECSDDAILSKDIDGVITTWNQAAERLFGYDASEVVGRPVTVIIPADRHHEEAAILERVQRGRRVPRYETKRLRKDGSLVDVAITVSPLCDASGRSVGASSILRDITERKEAQARQHLLMREMAHRVKNMLAVASGLVTLSARTAETPAAMAKAVLQRLGAYARAHDLARPSTEAFEETARVVTLRKIAEAIISPYMTMADGRPNVVIEGEDVPVAAEGTTGLALVFNELTTNAAKYGALSVPMGSLLLHCRAEAGQVEIVWTEKGGPPLDGPPGTNGFGTLLATRTVESQLGGTLQREWRPEGLRVVIRLPANRLA